MVARKRVRCLVGGVWLLVTLAAGFSFQNWQRENSVEGWYRRNGYKLVGGWLEHGYRGPDCFGVYKKADCRPPRCKLETITEEQFEAATGEVLREDKELHVVYSEYCVRRFFMGSEAAGPGRPEEREAYERYWRDRCSPDAAPIGSR